MNHKNKNTEGYFSEQIIPLSAGDEVRGLLKLHGITPQHRRGQNFLIDDGVYDDILSAAELTPADTVLEVGPGLGTLTAKVADVAKRVIAVEIDPKLAIILAKRFTDQKNVTVMPADILAGPVTKLGVTAPYKVVANIPYNITGAILKKFLSTDTKPTSMTLLVQREVAQRLTAKAGDMSLLAVSVQLYGKPKLMRTIPRHSFKPAPLVESALIAIKDIQEFPYADADISEKQFWQVVRVGFAAKRKQLKNNLASGLQLEHAAVATAFEAVGLTPKCRAEDVTVEQWHQLTKQLLI